MFHHINKKIIILFLLLTCSLWADFEAGKAIFSAKCSSCHTGYIPEVVLKENFYSKNNTILNLKAPSENMIAYAITRGPLHVGDRSDPELQLIEIQEYLKSYLYNPNKQNSVCVPEIAVYYDIKESLKGKISEDEITDLADFFFEYRKERLKATPKKHKKLSPGDDMNALLQEAKEQNKTIIIEAMSPTCHFCKQMDAEVFSQANVQQALEKDFLFLSVDVDALKLPFGLEKKFTGMTPTFFTINGDGGFLNVYPGSWTAQDFLEILDENRGK